MLVSRESLDLVGAVNIADYVPSFRALDLQGVSWNSPRIDHVGLLVTQLVHCFDWKLPEDVLPCDVDMTEKYALTLPRATHFSAVPKFRLRVKDA
ncbi:hypothetical protein GH714_043279 [Hevea brasiliensis]|uniref:Cytochrome P450 n=1 Tax=Hevea brasiliensis TaxID=3981 RepID=A0A6A6K2K2_HEVBR|nr:hypothetical protein GH714_043279 [Hevea brasiliensis]